MSSLEALLPDDLEKHVQLNRARLNSYGVLREEIKTYCVSVEVMQMLETRSRKARHTQEEMTRWTSVRLAKAKANKAKASQDGHGVEVHLQCWPSLPSNDAGCRARLVSLGSGRLVVLRRPSGLRPGPRRSAFLHTCTQGSAPCPRPKHKKKKRRTQDTSMKQDECGKRHTIMY